MTRINRLSNTTPQSNQPLTLSHPKPPYTHLHPFPSSSTQFPPCTPSPPITSRQSSTRSPHTHAGPPAHHLKTEDRPSHPRLPLLTTDPQLSTPRRSAQPNQPKPAAAAARPNSSIIRPRAAMRAEKTPRPQPTYPPVSKHEEARRKEKSKKESTL
ncbi:hypothetical protein COCMIDRAFT_36261 [Bipolaris oryzae ATCC 44560]|uniref:Uncharacterized protein n=1 Tax=Bipolaris oryzae ATCC 44560 TaxID=930090 RepID=W6Z8D9_COCMI|nr:uncharacterized protein COCMIDRAFT_36261 [Bipolaris oryzae ATCC 44560]EUC46058.1 hypothetical protein COCMIDRAFT_36261 [Bipolaris oryzae ATCC 44560]